MAIVGAVAFAAIACLELYLLVRRPEAEWYDGRAVAESAKTPAWRYAIGGGAVRDRHRRERFTTRGNVANSDSYLRPGSRQYSEVITVLHIAARGIY
jgi:hypothetical protein